ncbi:hypothetical protein BV20DRAFT_972582 [Pilatotrama ljubarskyi]|nr:hypothetical protein BV20DRAFT_972582 [Pilatotrama ljubarskyi]
MVGRRSLSGVLFISGISCFGISLFLNVLSLVLANTGNEASEFVALFAHFRDAIISILISRFLLDLLEVRMSTDDSEEERDVLPTDWTEDFHGVHTSASGIAGISCRHGGGSEGFSEALPGSVYQV